MPRTFPSNVLFRPGQLAYVMISFIQLFLFSFSFRGRLVYPLFVIWFIRFEYVCVFLSHALSVFLNISPFFLYPLLCLFRYDTLRRMLVAFSWLNPRIGYCQGLNRLGAFLFLILEEEEPFWGLVGVVENHMGYEYYIDPLILARADLLIFKVTFRHEVPYMVKKFDALDFDVGAVSFQWFFSLFVTTIPANFVVSTFIEVSIAFCLVCKAVSLLGC